MTVKDNIRPYITVRGKQQFKPSIQLCMTMVEDSEGFCLACGEIADGIEPDARRCTCEACGEAKVYGAEELVLMGLTFDAEAK